MHAVFWRFVNHISAFHASPVLDLISTLNWFDSANLRLCFHLWRNKNATFWHKWKHCCDICFSHLLYHEFFWKKNIKKIVVKLSLFLSWKALKQTGKKFFFYWRWNTAFIRSLHWRQVVGPLTAGETLKQCKFILKLILHTLRDISQGMYLSTWVFTSKNVHVIQKNMFWKF